MFGIGAVDVVAGALVLIIRATIASRRAGCITKNVSGYLTIVGIALVRVIHGLVHIAALDAPVGHRRFSDLEHDGTDR